MHETCCEAYNNWGNPAMETFLYHGEYNMFTENAEGDHELDDLIYYQLFECNV